MKPVTKLGMANEPKRNQILPHWIEWRLFLFIYLFFSCQRLNYFTALQDPGANAAGDGQAAAGAGAAQHPADPGPDEQALPNPRGAGDNGDEAEQDDDEGDDDDDGEEDEDEEEEEGREEDAADANNGGQGQWSGRQDWSFWETQLLNFHPN